MDIATDFANREVYAIVKEKWDSLPHNDNKSAKKRLSTPAKQTASASQTKVRVLLCRNCYWSGMGVNDRILLFTCLSKTLAPSVQFTPILSLHVDRSIDRNL